MKRIAKAVIPSGILLYLRLYKSLHRNNKNISIWDVLRKGNVASSINRLDYKDVFAKQFITICRKMSLDVSSYYIYPYDQYTVREINRCAICSITVDYSRVLNSSIDDLVTELSNCENYAFSNREMDIITGVKVLHDRVQNRLKQNNTKRAKELLSFFPKSLYEKPNSFDAAIQKLLFYNALFWQVGHYHIGLGRLDKILLEYYENDIEKGKITKDIARGMLEQMVLTLGKDTRAKSATLVGDTGQYILLGGVDEIGHNVQNSLTLLFLDLFKDLKITDPKLILRVNESTLLEVWQKAVECILTGCGSPLLMNEKPIMERMVDFGYDQKDVWNVGTSACWEPLIINKSFDQNNPLPSIIAIKPLNDILSSEIDYASFEELYNSYLEQYKKEIINSIHDIEFDCSPLLSLFCDDCFQEEEDFTTGGAKYSFHGAQVVSLPNVVNSLLNIKEFVYVNKLFSLKELRDAVISNFEGHKDTRTILLSNEKKFGLDNPEVLSLTQDIMSFTNSIIDKCTCNGKPIKVGFSSPAYIERSSSIGATLDGRFFGDPFAVHISPISANIGIPEILDFASHLKYEKNVINGNVVDIIVPPSYRNNKDKLISILKNACSNGVVEIQLNVLDKATLIDAKENPEKYPDLIVRVWGFSAYFNDLPEEYKDNLIRRAENYAAS